MDLELDLILGLFNQRKSIAIESALPQEFHQEAVIVHQLGGQIIGEDVLHPIPSAGMVPARRNSAPSALGGRSDADAKHQPTKHQPTKHQPIGCPGDQSAFNSCIYHFIRSVYWL